MTTDVESRFHEAMLAVYRRARAEANYNATRFLSMVVERGGLETARYLLHAEQVSDGYTALWERQRLDLTVEALILQPEWQSLFSDDERRIAVKRLREYGYSGPLPDVAPALRDQLDARVPKRQRQHYVPQWILKGFAGHNGLLHAWQIREARAFGPTGPEALFAGTNINTALSDDRTEILAYSEEAHTWMDWHASRTALAVRDAARVASWSPNSVRVITAPDEKILTWFTGLPVRQIARSPNARRLARQVADRHQMTSEQTDVMKVESGTVRLPETEAYLDTGRPTVLRSSPGDPLIVGDDIVVMGPPAPDGRPSFVGVLIDQHTILGRSFGHDRRGLKSNEVEVVALGAKDVMPINRDTTARAETIAGSHKGLVDGLGEAESRSRSVETR